MKILNFGSLNIDRVYSMPHIVQGGETLSSLNIQNFCGGKGLNQSVALARAGADVYHAGAIGADGGMLTEMLTAAGADCRFIEKRDAESGHAVIQVDKNGQNGIILFGGANFTISHEQIEKTFAFFENSDVLLVQNETNMLPDIIKAAGEKGMRIALNPSPIGEQLDRIDKSLITWFIMNEIEGEQLSGCKCPNEITKKILQQYPESAVVLTLGKNGAVYSDKNIFCSHGIYKTDVVDSTGAGDTFTGFFLASLTSGATPEKALEIASKAASVAVSRKGAARSIPTLNEIESTVFLQ